jgi:hypothetical protein
MIDLDPVQLAGFLLPARWAPNNHRDTGGTRTQQSVNIAFHKTKGQSEDWPKSLIPLIGTE